MTKRFLRRRVEDEEIWVDLQRGEFLGLNVTAARILELVRAGLTDPAAIAARLVTEFEVSLEDAQEGVAMILEQAERLGLTEE